MVSSKMSERGIFGLKLNFIAILAGKALMRTVDSCSPKFAACMISKSQTELSINFVICI